MRAWLARRLAGIAGAGPGYVVVMDPHAVVDPAQLPVPWVVAEDWWAVRSVYERQLRDHRSGPAVVLLARGTATGRPLPWDIERNAALVLVVRLPGPPALHPILAGLDPDDADEALTAIDAGVAPAAAVLRAVTGVDVMARAGPLPIEAQLRVAARVGRRADVVESLRELLEGRVTDPALTALLEIPSRPAELQRQWEDFLDGVDVPLCRAFESPAAAELGLLVAPGLLRRVETDQPVSPWARPAVVRPGLDVQLRRLLAQPPPDLSPALPEGWIAIAEWWGEVRRLAAFAPAAAPEAWRLWAGIDAAFEPWLRSNYGRVLSSVNPWPAAVHRVAPMLARRLRSGLAHRVLLIVLDGLGHAQWAHLRRHAGLNVHESGSTFALVPTYTTISRQAIFAADLPLAFPTTLWTTDAERKHWARFWAAQDVGVTPATYARVRGRFPRDRIELSRAPAAGVVVNAVDDFMHTAELLGDAQLLANLDAWVANGFLHDLVQRATADGVEVWLTADHGNLECVAGGATKEGVAVEAASKRLIRYPNRTLRDASSVPGIDWDPIPGMPPDASPIRFANGRLAFTNNPLSVSHGGLSLDEAIVPLVRVSA